ncbi:MAG TPA: F0F1 ATP synthase subunit B [Propionibacteriaceae bacterium]|nr:F0F1 ATP synthase subunit B [Propionibacteriaceae bacterium]
MTPMIDLGPLLPEYPSEFIMGFLLMVVVWLVLRAKVVPMFEQMYVERADQIQGGIERAEKAQAEAEAALASYRAQLETAREEAAKIREDAKAQAAQFLVEQRERATAEAARLLEQARHQIEAERVQAAEQLRSEVGGLATTLAGKVIGESLADDARAKATIDRFIAELEADVSEGQPA